MAGITSNSGCEPDAVGHLAYSTRDVNDRARIAALSAKVSAETVVESSNELAR